jgi:hypothetical protein
MKGRTIDQANNEARRRARVQSAGAKQKQARKEQDSTRSEPSTGVNVGAIVGAAAVGYVLGSSSQAPMVANPVKPGGDLDCGL